MEPASTREQKNAAIADLMNQLADVSAEERALADYRRQARAFDAGAAAARAALDLLALETTARGRGEIRGLIDKLRRRLAEQGLTRAVALIDADSGTP